MSGRLSKELKTFRSTASGPKRFALPEAFISCDGPVVRVWSIIFPTREGRVVGICTVTEPGTVSVWKPFGRGKLLHLATDIGTCLTAELVLSCDPFVESLLLIQSRFKGIRIFRFNTPTPYSAAGPSPAEMHVLMVPYQPHPGFCTLQLYDDMLVFPSTPAKYGIISVSGLNRGAYAEQITPRLVREETTDALVMFVKVVNTPVGEEFLMYGTETGTIKMATIIRVQSDQNGTEQVVIIPWKNTLNLNTFECDTKQTNGAENGIEHESEREEYVEKPEPLASLAQLAADVVGGAIGGAFGAMAIGGGDVEPEVVTVATQTSPVKGVKEAEEEEAAAAAEDGDESVSPLCCEVFPLVDGAFIGTNTNFVYKLTMDSSAKTMSFEFRKRFPNKGVNCMHIHPNGKLLATGGWDGGIRVLSVAGLTPVLYIPYHIEPVSAVRFFNPSMGPISLGFGILAGSQDGQVSVWNPKEKLSQASQA